MPSNSDRKTQHVSRRRKIQDQKANRVNISRELLDRVSVNENFLKTIVTGDETWVYGYNVETKAQSSQWVAQGSPQPKEARMS